MVFYVNFQNSKPCHCTPVGQGGDNRFWDTCDKNPPQDPILGLGPGFRPGGSGDQDPPTPHPRDPGPPIFVTCVPEFLSDLAPLTHRSAVTRLGIFEIYIKTHLDLFVYVNA